MVAVYAAVAELLGRKPQRRSPEALRQLNLLCVFGRERTAGKGAGGSAIVSEAAAPWLPGGAAQAADLHGCCG